MTELIYLGHDNTIDLLLKSDGVIVNITASTRMTVEIGSTTIDSDVSASAFDWSEGDGVLYLAFGDQTIPAGIHNAVLTVYDSTHTDGVVWGSFKCTVK